MPTPDARLVEMALDGDQAAFTELYDRYARLVRAVCRDGASDLNQAQDLAQEVFLRAYNKLIELKDPQRFAYWLTGIARNVARENRRKLFRERHLWIGDEAEDLADELADPTAGRDSDRLALLEQAMKVLSEQERLALHSFYLQGQDIERARAAVGCSRSGFYRLLERARQRVEQFVRQREGQ